MLTTLLLAAALAGQPATVKGVWELDAGASVHNRVIGETVSIGGDERHESYSAVVTFQGKTSGAKFDAEIDGPEVPLYALDGKVVGRARVRSVEGGRTITELMPTQGVQRIIDHRVSIDGKSMLSLLLDRSGNVLSILVFRRTS